MGLSRKAPSYATVPTSGLFAFQQSKLISNVIDGMSNTIAFSESTVGNVTQVAGQKMFGIVSVALPAAALQPNAFNNPPGVLSGIATCSKVWGASPTVDAQRGDTWTQGAMTSTLFNTIVPPNGQANEWAYCSATSNGGVANYSNADSYHPGGVNVGMADGSIRFIKNSINQTTWWALGTIAGGEVLSSDSY
jgi:prepilin-type processing-associated H-X9-DG protein